MVGADGEVVRRRPRLDLLVGAMGEALRWTPSLRQPEGQIKRVSHPYARFHHA